MSRLCGQPAPGMISRARTGFAALVVVLLLATQTGAHPLTFTATELLIRVNGTFRVDMVCDLDALALGAPQDADDAELVATLRELTPDEFAERVQRLGRFFQRRVRVRFDGKPAPFDVAFPDYGLPQTDEAEIPTVLGLTARLTGVVPAGTTEVEFFASRSFANIHLSILHEADSITHRSVLERGARSDPFVLTGPAEPADRVHVARQYLRLGFTHIVPDGLDHILFVLGLFLLSVTLRPLVWQVTAFTVAHASTVTLASLGVVDLPARIVEPLIALSIVYVAIENVLTNRLTPWRPLVVFAFGLLHGLGFAGAIRELGLPQSDRLIGLVSFNVGIELGQLIVIGGALLTIGWFRDRRWYRPRLVIPASIAIAIVGGIWAVERLAS